MTIYENKYRITYEAFSKFSAKLSKANDKAELLEIVQKHLKYLFNYKYFRLLLKDDIPLKSFQIFYNSKQLPEFIINKTFCYEEKLLENHIPIQKSVTNDFFEENSEEINLVNGKLWAWYFNYQDLQLCVSIISDDEKPFIVRDIEILNLLIDTFVTKYQQIKLKNRLHQKNVNLQNAINVIEEQKFQISKIVYNQKNTIEQRTKKLKDQNNRLAEISRLNAHNVREPLSRILGLIEIAEFYKEEDLRKEIFEKIKTSAIDLDQILQDIINKSNSAIEKLSSHISPQNDAR